MFGELSLARHGQQSSCSHIEAKPQARSRNSVPFRSLCLRDMEDKVKVSWKQDARGSSLSLDGTTQEKEK